MKTYTFWTNLAEDSVTGTEGEGPLHFVDGTVDPDRQVLLYKIQAETYEEAMAIHHLRMGWKPYNPEGAPAPCPKCNSLLYPSGSGVCWKCGEESES
jgi:hypothetical protein